jgi:hypothetical protein
MDEMRQLIESVKSELKTEISLFKEQVSSEFVRVDERLRALTVEQARARGDIEWLKGNMVTRDEFKSSINLILGRFDSFAKKWDNNGYHLAKHGEQLVDHEKRLAHIETERS